MNTELLTPAPAASGATSNQPAQTVSFDKGTGDPIERLRQMSIRGLHRMFSTADGICVFRVRKTADGVVQEGLSPRYTAITLLGLAHRREDATYALAGAELDAVTDHLLRHAASSRNLGDVALSLWAGNETGAPHSALAPVARQLASLEPAARPHPVVELAWALSALSETDSDVAMQLRDRTAARLLDAFGSTSKLFPHLVGGAGGARGHVSCFADLIYPIQALSKYALRTNNQRALDVASACAAHLCSMQGDAGQWWWHYDYRTGRVLERYPVYAIHQDAMGPMGLRALKEAGGLDCSAATQRGLDWLFSAPELSGGSLIDSEADLIWRKVARREPRKLVRYMQSGLSSVHSSLRVPAVDAVFPPGIIDYEDRPYHLGWLLYAWAPRTGRTADSGARS